MSSIDYDPFDPTVRHNPSPYYAMLRRDAPVWRIPALDAWAVSRHEDVLTVLRRHDLFSSAAMGVGAFRPEAFVTEDRRSRVPAGDSASLIGSDPPAHTRLRAIVSRGFTPKHILALEPRIRDVAATLLDRFLPDGACDLVADFAVPLPVVIIAELLGVDADRQHDFKRWSDALLQAVFDRPEPAEAQAIGLCLQELSDYFEAVIADRRRHPTDDLISTLVRAEEADGVLTSDEVRVFVFTLLVAGNVTTTNLIGNAVLALLQHPDELARVSRDLSLVPGLVEEALRYDTPAQVLFRIATEKVVLAGVTIPAGSLVAPLAVAPARRPGRPAGGATHGGSGKRPAQG